MSSSGTNVAYAGLNPAYTTSQSAGMPITGSNLPFFGTGSGTQGYGQIYEDFFTPSDIVYQGTTHSTVFNESPVGLGAITISWYTSDPSQVGGTGCSFIAYDDADPLLKTKQIYMDNEGLVVGNSLNTAPIATTLTPINLNHDNNGTTTSALIEDIINVGNLNLTGTITNPSITLSPTQLQVVI